MLHTRSTGCISLPSAHKLRTRSTGCISEHQPFSIMKLLSLAPIAFVALVCLLRASHAQCMDSYRLYEILAAPNGEMEIDDGYGNRTIKAELVGLNKCGDWVKYPTGLETPLYTGGGSGLTTLSMSGSPADGQTDDTDGSCRINNSSRGGQTSHWWPIRAIRVTALDGWRITPKSIRVSDVDMEGAEAVEGSLRKAALVWGFNGNEAVNATWDLSGSSLITHEMKIESPALNSLGFKRASGMHEWLTGVMTTYGDRSPQAPLLRCNTGADEAPCAATASFEVPVEGFYVMGALEWKSLSQAAALISIGDLQLKCGCRCNTVKSTNVVTFPTGEEGECRRRKSSGASSTCAEYGLNWCERREYTRWVVTGPETDGVYSCASTIGFGAKFMHAYGGMPEPTTSLVATAQQQALQQLQQQELAAVRPTLQAIKQPVLQEAQAIKQPVLQEAQVIKLQAELQTKTAETIIKQAAQTLQKVQTDLKLQQAEAISLPAELQTTAETISKQVAQTLEKVETDLKLQQAEAIRLPAELQTTTAEAIRNKVAQTLQKAQTDLKLQQAEAIKLPVQFQTTAEAIREQVAQTLQKAQTDLTLQKAKTDLTLQQPARTIRTTSASVRGQAQAARRFPRINLF